MNFTLGTVQTKVTKSQRSWKGVRSNKVARPARERVVGLSLIEMDCPIINQLTVIFNTKRKLNIVEESVAMAMALQIKAFLADKCGQWSTVGLSCTANLKQTDQRTERQVKKDGWTDEHNSVWTCFVSI